MTDGNAFVNFVFAAICIIVIPALCKWGRNSYHHAPRVGTSRYNNHTVVIIPYPQDMV